MDYEFAKSLSKEMGTWKPIKKDGRKSALVTCPKCGKCFSLNEMHLVDADGTVSPSIICPNGDCNFHGFCKLLDWES